MTLDANVFDNIASTDNKYQIKLKNYLIPDVSPDRERSSEFIPYNEAEIDVKEPQISTWDFLDEQALKTFLDLKRAREIRCFINNYLPKDYPKGFSRMIFRELMYNALKFCKFYNFNLKQTGVVLSQYYLTHLYFTSCLNMGPQKVYTYFKQLQLHHSVFYPPSHMNYFSLHEAKIVMVEFCRIYLRNLPLIRFLSLPNFALCATYKLEPEPNFDKKSKKKKKKKGGKKKKGKKGKKK